MAMRAHRTGWGFLIALIYKKITLPDFRRYGWSEVGPPPTYQPPPHTFKGLPNYLGKSNARCNSSTSATKQHIYQYSEQENLNSRN